MKKYTFPTTATCILLASVLLLTGCMYAVMDDMGTSKEYTSDIADQIVSLPPSDIIIETPTAQSAMQKKFNVYLHETDGGGVRIFSKNQHNALTQIRDSGERVPLTYNEVLYLISDTINLYFKYDEITLTNPRFLSAEDVLQYGSVTPDTVDATYKTYHGSFLEFLSEEDKLEKACAKYNEMVETICLIICYRLYMHDAGMEHITHYIDLNGDRHPLQFSSGMLDPTFCVLSLDGSSQGGNENKTKLEQEFGKLIPYQNFDAAASKVLLNAPLLVIPIAPYQTTAMHIVSPESSEATQVFPTTELNARAPEKELTLTASLLTEGRGRQTLHLNRETGQFELAGKSTDCMTIVGTFTEQNRTLVLYPENLSEDGTYVYRFYRTGNGLLEAYVYNANASDPYKGFDFPEGMAFCRNYGSYLNDQAFKKDSGVVYIVDNAQYHPDSFARSVYVMCDDEDADLRVRVNRTVPPYSELVKTELLTEITLYIGKGYDGKLTASLPRGAEIESVTLYTFGPEPAETKTTLQALSDLQSGEYYVAVDLVISEKYCGVDTTRWVNDFFKLTVKHV